MFNPQRQSVLLVMLAFALVLAACGGGSLEPAEYFEELGSAVEEFNADLAGIDEDLISRQWEAPIDSDASQYDSPEAFMAVYRFRDSIWREAMSEYVKANERFVDRLEALRPPETVPGVEGELPPFHESLVEVERTYLADHRLQLAALEEAVDLRAGDGATPEEMRAADDRVMDLIPLDLFDNPIEDIWESMQEGAEEGGFYLDEVVELRIEFENLSFASRAWFLAGEITEILGLR